MSVRNRDPDWHPGARRDPLLISLEFDAKLVIEDSQVAVVVTHDGLRHHGLHFLRHYADIGSVAAVIAESIEADAVGEMPEKLDIVLEHNVRPPAASAATATTAPAAAASTTRSHAAATAARARDATATTAAETRVSARGLRMGGSARLDISKRIAAA